MFRSAKFTQQAEKAAAQRTVQAFLPGHFVAHPTRWRAGIVFASPHSGALYPAEFLAQSKLSASDLRRNEDMFIDKLMAPVVIAGAPLLSARFPRCFVDVNRAPDEITGYPNISATQPTGRAAAGLGVIPTHLNETIEIYKTKPTAADVQARLQALYHPYHTALRDLLRDAQARFGQALLIDCHSMPGFAPMGSRRPDIILGDRFGVSCYSETLALIRDIFERAGYTVGVNYPYAGGYVTRHYGQPKSGIEAIQIEINRDLYLNPVTHKPKRSYGAFSDDIADITRQIIDAAIPEHIAAQ